MSGEAIVKFLMTEAVLALVMMICVWGVSKMPWDATPKQLATVLCYVLFGGLMLVVLIRFTGVF